MRRKLTYAQARALDPDAVQNIVELRSVCNNPPAEEDPTLWEWRYECYLSGKPRTLKQYREGGPREFFPLRELLTPLLGTPAEEEEEINRLVTAQLVYSYAEITSDIWKEETLNMIAVREIEIKRVRLLRATREYPDLVLRRELPNKDVFDWLKGIKASNGLKDFYLYTRHLEEQDS